MRSREMRPSSLVSSLPRPVAVLTASQTWSPPMTAHRALVHTPTWYSPTGWRRNWL